MFTKSNRALPSFFALVLICNRRQMIDLVGPPLQGWKLLELTANSDNRCTWLAMGAETTQVAFRTRSVGRVSYAMLILIKLSSATLSCNLLFRLLRSPVFWIQIPRSLFRAAFLLFVNDDGCSHKTACSNHSVTWLRARKTIPLVTTKEYVSHMAGSGATTFWQTCNKSLFAFWVFFRARKAVLLTCRQMLRAMLIFHRKSSMNVFGRIFLQ